MAPGQLAYEGGWAGCALRYFAGTICFLASTASTDVLQQQLLLHSPMVATTDTAVSLAKNIGLAAAHKEPPGLLRTDSKRPDGVTLLLWKNGRYATCDVTVTDTMAQFYLHNTSRTSGAAAEAAADKKTAKIRSTSADLCLCSNCRRNHGSHQQQRIWIPRRPGKAHYTSHRWYPRVCLPPSCSSACQSLFSATMRSPSRAPLPTQPLGTNSRPFQLICF